MSRILAFGVAVLMLGWCQAAQASLVEIQFLGLDLVYDGTRIYDAKDPAGGFGDSNQADPLTAVEFFVDGVSVGTITDNIWADILIQDVQNIPAGGGGITSGNNGDVFGFDVLIGIGGLALNLETFQVFYTGGKIAIAGGALASSVADQDLPFGLVLEPNQPVTIAFSSASLHDVTEAGGFLTGFRASGTGNVQGVLVPEPASGTLLIGCGLGLALWRRRRK